MDPTEARLEHLSSNFQTLAYLTEKDKNISLLALDTHNAVKYAENDGELGYLKPNLLQIERIADLISIIGEDSTVIYDDFMCGAMLALRILDENSETGYDHELYKALNALYYEASKKANMEYSNNAPTIDTVARKRAISGAMQDILNTDIVFFGVPDDEESYIQDCIEELGGDEESSYDVMRGYRLVRMATLWHEQIEYKKDINSRQKKDELKRFYDMFSGESYEMRPLDGLESCDDDVRRLVLSVRKNLSKYPVKFLRELSNYETIKSELEDKLIDEFVELEGLTLNDNITVAADTVIEIYSKGQYYGTLPVPRSSTIRGAVIGITIAPIPFEKDVRAGIKGKSEKLKDRTKHNSIPWSVMLRLGHMIIQDDEGKLIETKPEDEIYLPIEYSGTRVWRDKER